MVSFPQLTIKAERTEGSSHWTEREAWFNIRDDEKTSMLPYSGWAIKFCRRITWLTGSQAPISHEWSQGSTDFQAAKLSGHDRRLQQEPGQIFLHTYVRRSSQFLHRRLRASSLIHRMWWTVLVTQDRNKVHHLRHEPWTQNNHLKQMVGSIQQQLSLSYCLSLETWQYSWTDQMREQTGMVTTCHASRHLVSQRRRKNHRERLWCRQWLWYVRCDRAFFCSNIPLGLDEFRRERLKQWSYGASETVGHL